MRALLLILFLKVQESHGRTKAEEENQAEGQPISAACRRTHDEAARFRFGTCAGGEFVHKAAEFGFRRAILRRCGDRYFGLALKLIPGVKAGGLGRAGS
jgi:hypothetical protein